MISLGDELETFKTDINLTQYGAASGYRLDRKASSRNSVLMVHPSGTRSSSASTRTGTNGGNPYPHIRNGE
jgi:hypothetical protein